MPGLTLDQIAYYQKDMYAAQLEAVDELPSVRGQVYKEVSGGIHSEGLGHKETRMLKLGQLVEQTAENEDIAFKSPVQGWTTYTAYKTFTDGVKFSKNAIDRTVKSKVADLLTKLAKSWGMSEVVEKETYAAAAFNNGGTLAGNAVFNGTSDDLTDSSGDLLYDSVPFFALSGNNHATKGNSTGYYNSVASLTLTPANFETIYNLHTATNNVDELDRKISNPADTLLTAAGSDALAAKRILKSQQLPGGQLNDLNVYSELGLMPISWDYLTDSAFYVGKRQADEVQFINAQPAEIRFSRDETNLCYMASINVMFSVWFKAGAWRRWTRGGGSAA